MHTNSLSHTHTNSHTHKQTQTLTHTHTHTHKLRHTHTYTQTSTQAGTSKGKRAIKEKNIRKSINEVFLCLDTSVLTRYLQSFQALGPWLQFTGSSNEIQIKIET